MIQSLAKVLMLAAPVVLTASAAGFTPGGADLHPDPSAFLKPAGATCGGCMTCTYEDPNSGEQVAGHWYYHYSPSDRTTGYTGAQHFYCGNLTPEDACGGSQHPLSSNCKTALAAAPVAPGEEARLEGLLERATQGDAEALTQLLRERGGRLEFDRDSGLLYLRSCDPEVYLGVIDLRQTHLS